jgi:hypothetical protein
MTSGEASDLQWLLSEIDRLPDGPGAKAGVMEILCRMVGLRVYFSKRVVLRAARVREVVRMLEGGATRAQARDRLMRRYQIGRTKAYALIQEALTVRGSATIADGD